MLNMLTMLRDLLLNTILTRTAIFAFLLSSYDKMAAAAKKQRVPERVFCLVSALGGFWGLCLSFVLFNHKMRKQGFLLKIICCYLLRLVFWGN